MSEVIETSQSTESSLILLEDIFPNLVAPFKRLENTLLESAGSLKIFNEDALCELFEKKAIETRFRKQKDSLQEVIGILEGPYFRPDGESVNNRFYERALWENVLKNKAGSLKENGVLGTFMHPKTAQEAHPLKASHVLSGLWMDETLGYGKSYILNTPTGEMVRTLASSTNEEGKPLIHLATSSRARGELSKRKTPKGMPIVDPNTYLFETFDIVLEPGIPEAYPTFFKVINESVEYFNDVIDTSGKSKFFMSQQLESKAQVVPTKSVEESPSKGLPDTIPNLNGGYLMEGEMLKSKLSEYENMGSITDLAKKDALLQAYSELGTVSELAELISKVEGLVDSKVKLESEVEDLKINVDDLKKIEIIAGDAEKSKEMVEQLSEYKRLGTVRELNTMIESMTAFFKRNGTLKLVEEKLADVAALKDIGSVKEISEVVSMVESFVKEYGTFNEARKVIDMTESFVKDYGTLTEARKVIDMTESFVKEYGTFNEAKQVIDNVESFVNETGSFVEVNEAMSKFQTMVHDAFITEKAKLYNVPESFVRSLVTKHAGTNMDLIEESLQTVSNQVKEISEAKQREQEEKTKQLNENKENKSQKPVAGKQTVTAPIKIEEDVEVKPSLKLAQLREMASRINTVVPSKVVSKVPTFRR